MTAHAVVYNSRNQETFFDGKYKLNWAFDATEERVYFKVEVNRTGYVALGFSDQGSYMMNLDCVVAGVCNGQPYIMVCIWSWETDGIFSYIFSFQFLALCRHLFV